MLCQISKDLLIRQNYCWANYHIVIITMPKMGMFRFNTPDKLLINKPFVGPTNSFLQCILPCYEEWKSIVYREVRNNEMNKWTEYCVSHPNLHLAKACTDNTPPQKFWSLIDQYPGLVRHLHVQVRLMGNLGFNAGMPLLSDTDGRKCFICKNGVEGASHFFFDYMSFRENFTILWSNLKTSLFNANPSESNFMFSFLVNLDRKHKTMFLLRGFVFTIRQ